MLLIIDVIYLLIHTFTYWIFTLDSINPRCFLMVDHWTIGRSGSLAKFLALNLKPRKLLATDLPHRLKDLRNALHGIAAAETWHRHGGDETS